MDNLRLIFVFPNLWYCVCDKAVMTAVLSHHITNQINTKIVSVKV